MNADRRSDGTSPSTPREPIRIVGIGASAGGLDAIERFFDNLPKDTGMAFVVVQHLSPDFKSLMDELLARHTELPIHLVEDGMLVEANHVYLIPSGKQMIISEGRLLLSERESVAELALPIDVFFRSLARDCGRRAVAIVLSGGGSDGSRGICDIVEAGGLVIVQDAESAQFDGMPRMAIDAGVAQWVLAPQDMPRVLLEHAAGHPQEPPEQVPPAMATVYRMLREQFAIDFTHYKPNTITRRIERRLALARSQDIDDYVDRLQEEREELDRLYRDLLIGVTSFFRDPDAFLRLERDVFPEMLHRLPAGAPLRLWVAGCATGEEVYSLAIVLHDVMAREGHRPVNIFATDVHRASLDKATLAIYDEAALAKVSSERLARYFLRCGDSYQVVPDLRQTIVFAQHDVIKDAPFTRMDLIVCRNLLIYLKPKPQEKVLSLFHFGLNREGVLFLGPSETVGSLSGAFDTIDRNWRLFRKRSQTTVSDSRTARPADVHDGRAPAMSVPAPGGRHSLGQLLGVYDALLDTFLPPGLLLTERGEVVHAFAGGSGFLKPRDGRMGLNVLDLVEAELRMILSGGLKRVSGESSSVVYNGVRLTIDGKSSRYKVTLVRVEGRRGGEPHVLVSFESLAEELPAAAPASKDEVELGLVPGQHISALEAELARTKEHLQSTIEQLESSNEEMQASNEELHTSNEELQSTNEELQSVNEELYTVNAEYQRKIGELTVLTNDMDNLLASTEVGTIFLDAELRIRRFTPQMAEVFTLLPQDVGRPIETFATRMAHPELMDDLRRVLSGAGTVEKEMVGPQGGAYFLRILPYRAKGTIEGVVLTLIDVSGLKAAEDALFHERYLLRSLLSGVPDAIYFKDLAGKFVRANDVMATRFGLKDASEAVGKTPFDLPNQEAAMAMHQEDELVLRSGQAQHYRLERRREGGSDRWDLVTRLPLRDRAGQVVGIIVTFRDVTEVKRAEEQIQDAVKRRDEFLAMLSHELRNPLGAIVTAVGMLKSEAPSASRLLEIMERQSLQMARLLDDLLEASRVTQSKIELRKRAVDLRRILREAVDAVRVQFDTRGIQLSLNLDPELIAVEGDPVRLQQIHVNLLSNAAKYTPGGGHVSLTASRQEEAAVVRVRDDGAGIPREMLGQVFDLFVQARRTLDRSAGGIGVGLTLVRALVEMHDGSVEALSDGEGKGSEFVVRLPLVRGPVENGVVTPAGPPTPLPVGARVLIVDDNVDSRELLCELLTHAGFACRTAGDGAEALALIQGDPPDIAILDIGLPEMDGLELARRIRQDPRLHRLHLIALTGYGRATDRSAVRDAGFDQHLVKPVEPGQLLALLTEMQRPSPLPDIAGPEVASPGAPMSCDFGPG